MAIDVEKQVEYWRNGADEDLAVARELLASRRIRHGMFFLHLALEKMLKAHVSRTTRQVPPKIHNLLSLLTRAGLSVDKSTTSLLADMDHFNLWGRYPSDDTPAPSPRDASLLLSRTRKVFRCLQERL